MMKFRKFVFSVHSVMGIAIGLFFAISGLTGSAIVFRKEVDRTLKPALMHVVGQAQLQSIDRIFSAAEQTHPKVPFRYVLFPKQPEDTFLIAQKMSNGQRIETYVNPYTAQVMGSRVWEHSALGFLHTLHSTLFLGTPGRLLVGVFGVLLFLTAITGTLRWTGWRNLKNGFRIRWNASMSVLSFDLHNVGGILTTALLSMIAFTGVVIVIAQLLIGGLPTVKLMSAQTPVAMSELLQLANAALPGGKISVVEFPEAQPNVIHIHKKFPEQMTGEVDLSVVEIDRYTGTVLKAEKVIKPNPVFKVLLRIRNLHSGRFGGSITRILYAFVGLVPLILFITGIVMYRHRGRTKFANRNYAELSAER
ncbi:MAG: PepSY domain-containing protein [Stigonema ocellatum SAG 48.90 = DSM 106950]|nr:PepSY domain-containing protein [Stigonema ocellatum SAG 48.90 = DSM 106950]